MKADLKALLSKIINKDVKFVTVNGITVSIASRDSWVGQMGLDISAYTNQGYTFIGFLPQSASSDFVSYGYRVYNNDIRLTAYNSYVTAQTAILGGVAIFSK